MMTSAFRSEPDLFAPTRSRPQNRGTQLLSGLRKTFTPGISRARSRSPISVNIISAPHGLHSTHAERRAPSVERPITSALQAPRGSASRPSYEQIAMGLHLTRTSNTAARGSATSLTAAPTPSRTTRMPPRRAGSLQQPLPRRPAGGSSPRLVPAPSPTRPAPSAPPRPGNGSAAPPQPMKSAFKKTPTAPPSPERAASYPPVSPRSAGQSAFLSVPTRRAGAGIPSPSSATSLASSASTGTLVYPDPPRATGFKARVSRFWPGGGASARAAASMLSGEVAPVSSRTSEEATLASGSDDGHGGPYKRKAVRFNNSGPIVMT